MPPRRSKRKRPKRRRRPRRRRAPKKTKTYHDKLRKTNDTRLKLNKWKKKSLKERVSALETTVSKHYDTIQGGLAVAHKINWNGVSFTGMPADDPRNSFKSCLSITPRFPDGTVQRFSGSVFPGTVTNQRNDKSVFAKTLRLRGKILGLRPKAQTNVIGGTAGPPDPATGVLPLAGTIDPAARSIQECYTKVWMVVLEDTDPGKIVLPGMTEPNDYEAAGTGNSPIESIAQSSNADNTLEIYGYGQMLKSYNSSRFKVKQAQAYILTANKPQVEFDVTIDINRELLYTPLPYDQANPVSGTRPYNYGLVVYFLFATDTTGSIDYTKLHAPETRHLTSRLKFLD